MNVPQNVDSKCSTARDFHWNVAVLALPSPASGSPKWIPFAEEYAEHTVSTSFGREIWQAYLDMGVVSEQVNLCMWEVRDATFRSQ